MGLKHTITALTEVAESVRSLYVQQGSVYVLDVDGVVPKDRLDEFRNNNIQLQQQLERLKGVDPVKYNELMELDRKVKEKELIAKGDVDGVIALRVQAMNEAHATEKNTLETQLQSSNRQLSALLIDNVVKGAAVTNGVVPSAMDDVALRAKAVFVVENGQPVAKDEKGNVIYGKDGTTPLTPAEWVTNLRKSAPHLFQGFSGSGAGGGRGTGSTDMSKLTAVQKIQLGIEQGGLVADLPRGN